MNGLLPSVEFTKVSAGHYSTCVELGAGSGAALVGHPHFNLRTGAILLATHHPSPLGAMVLLDLQLAGLELPIRTKAIVVFAKEVAPDAHQLALRFVELDADDFRRLAAYAATVAPEGSVVLDGRPSAA